jgi:DNA-binding NarL/FixJ family response regulator
MVTDEDAPLAAGKLPKPDLSPKRQAASSNPFPSRGREAAKQRAGVRFGRLRKLNPDQAKVASQLLSEGKAVRDIARTFNVYEATIYRLAAS